MSKIKLSKPVSWDGKEQTELDLGLDKMPGGIICEAETEFSALYNYSGVATLQMRFLAIVAAKLLKRPVDDIHALPARDFVKVIGAVDSFFG